MDIKNEGFQSLEQQEAAKIEIKFETFLCGKCSFMAKSKSSLTRHLNKTGHHDSETSKENVKNNRKEKKIPVKQIKSYAPSEPQKKENTVKTNVDLVNDFKQDIFCEFLKERRVIQQSTKLKDVLVDWMVATYPNIELDIDINDDFMKQMEARDRIEGIIGPSGRYCWVTKSERAATGLETDEIESPDPKDAETANVLLEKCGSENLIFGMKDALTATLLRRRKMSAQRLFDELIGHFPAYKPNSHVMVMRMLYVLNQDNDFVKDEATNIWTLRQNRELTPNVAIGLLHTKRRKIETEDKDSKTQNKDAVVKMENVDVGIKVEN